MSNGEAKKGRCLSYTFLAMRSASFVLLLAAVLGGCSVVNSVDDLKFDLGTDTDTDVDTDADTDSDSDSDSDTDTDTDADCVVYVDVDAFGANDGTSWADAFAELQPGIALAQTTVAEGDEIDTCQIWVAEGTYYAYVDAPEDTFLAPTDVELYGGFAGGESALDQRNWAANVTVLSGHDGPTELEQVYHVVTMEDGGLIDGLVVRDGNAVGSDPHDSGGGVTIDHVTGTTVRNCVIRDNGAGAWGGGVFVEAGGGAIENCVFFDNTAGYYGGGMYVNDSPLAVTNCTFVGNTVPGSDPSGGGIFDFDFDSPNELSITNTILWMNDPDNLLSDSTTFHAQVSNSVVGAGYPLGTDIIDLDPLFIDAPGGDFHLQGTSPCIDSGSGPAATPSDFDGLPRFDIPWIGNTGDGPPWADIGAFEYDGSALLWVPLLSGNYQMGSGEGLGDADEEPQHPVEIQAFDMAATEITVRQFRACVDTTACTAPGTGSDCNWDVPGREFDPINCVSWSQAVDFCEWAATGGRLPSEAEWEYAARAQGQGITYPWGEPAPVADNLAVMSGSSCNGTCPVCSEPDGNTLQGLCDTAGNVWEWVEDWYHPSYFYSSYSAPADGSAWIDPPGDERVMRGGSYGNLAGDLRTRNRAYYDPAGYAYLGFRCAR